MPADAARHEDALVGDEARLDEGRVEHRLDVDVAVRDVSGPYRAEGDNDFILRVQWAVDDRLAELAVVAAVADGEDLVAEGDGRVRLLAGGDSGLVGVDFTNGG